MIGYIIYNILIFGFAFLYGRFVIRQKKSGLLSGAAYLLLVFLFLFLMFNSVYSLGVKSTFARLVVVLISCAIFGLGGIKGKYW